MLQEKIQGIIDARGEDCFEAAVDTIAAAFDAQTVTLHRAEKGKELLHMLACRGIPPHLETVTKTIPFGKGMAGLCAERKDFVTVCNLQKDSSGVSRPAAKDTGVAGAIVVPIFGRESDEVIGTLGVGKPGEYEYSDEERQVLAACARALAGALEGRS